VSRERKRGKKEQKEGRKEGKKEGRKANIMIKGRKEGFQSQPP
jgi:hypothetical protein